MNPIDVRFCCSPACCWWRLPPAALPIQVDDQPPPSLAPMLEEDHAGGGNISTVSLVPAEDHPLLRDPVFRWFSNSRATRSANAARAWAR